MGLPTIESKSFALAAGHFCLLLFSSLLSCAYLRTVPLLTQDCANEDTVGSLKILYIQIGDPKFHTKKHSQKEACRGCAQRVVVARGEEHHTVTDLMKHMQCAIAKRK
jgi:hypothetical protein